MKADTLLCLSDSHLTVYRYVNNVLDLIDVYDLSLPESLERFSNWLKEGPSRNAALLLDVSCEDYYVEQLPHVRGRDRGLLLNRKITRYFPAEGFSHAELSTRLTTSRRDDIYFISGIVDSSSIDPVIDALVANDVTISGIYSLPQLSVELIRPIEHSKKLLVVTCDEDKSIKGRYTFRQTFVVNGKIYFSRKTSVSMSDGGGMAESVRKEIERTWQYLNNRRALELDSRMQVLMVLPEQIAVYLRAEPEASQCSYIYANASELAAKHSYASETGELTSACLTMFMLAKSGRRKSHYQPGRLDFIKGTSKIRRAMLNVEGIYEKS